jgi:hypothetical protein
VRRDLDFTAAATVEEVTESMTEHGSPERPRRETRLLVLVVAVSVAVLLVLARFRFPTSDVSVVAPSAAPLAGLTSRATFDDLGGSIADVLSRTAGRIAILGLAPDEPGTGRGRTSGASSSTVPAGPIAVRWLPSLRVATDLALLRLPVGWTVSTGLNLDGPVTTAIVDPATRLALVHAPSAAAVPDGLENAVTDYAGLSYLAAIEATPDGADVRPVFVGRVAPVAESPWPERLLRVPEVAGLHDGDLLFSLGGRFVGLAVGEGAESRIVTAGGLQALIASLSAKAAADR